MICPLISLAAALSSAGAAELSSVGTIVPVPPPPAMETESNPEAPAVRSPRTALWSIGEPSDQEQLYLELINRARANPTAEGLRLAAIQSPEILTYYNYFNVNLNTMKSEMSALPVAPPLAMNAKLIQSARGHSNDQLANKFQGHVSSNGQVLGQRLTAAGYSASNYAENVYATSANTPFGHAGFEVDWGSGSGGMQDGRGHRAIIHAGFREVGIGVVEGTNGSYGPQVVTQDFAIPAGTVTPFVTGVAYYDFNGNAFYDPGEGIGGITVQVPGASSHGVTATSGGYAVPVPAGVGTRTVTFTGPGLSASRTATFTGSGTNNVKADLILPYSPPVMTGPAAPVVSAGNQYACTAVPGAVAYDCRVGRKVSVATDTANDLSRVTTAVSGYNVLSTVRQEGAYSYHLAQPLGRNETITYKATFHAGAAPSLQFQSRLAAAMNTQKAYVQVSTDSGATWTTVDTQTGTGGSGQGSFSLRTVPLTGIAHRDFQLRFNYTISGTSFINGTNNSNGWFIDAVSFTDVLDTTGSEIVPLSSSTTFSFAPSAAGQWIISARPVIPGRTLGFGPPTEVTAVSSPSTFAAWASGFESSAGLAAGTLLNNPAADHNRDGVANLVAYALNLDPVGPATAGLPQGVAAAGTFRLDYPVVTTRTDVTLTPQISTDLRIWYAPGQSGAPSGFTDSVLSTSGIVQTRRASVPAPSATSGVKHYYFRLRAVKN